MIAHALELGASCRSAAVAKALVDLTDEAKLTQAVGPYNAPVLRKKLLAKLHAAAAADTAFGEQLASAGLAKAES